MNDLIDIGSYAKFMGSLAFVIALILALTWAAKRWGLVQGMPPQGRGRRDRRLRVVESLTLDARRRLVLVRHDDAEHLVLLGPNSDLVVGAASSPRSFAQTLTEAAPSPIVHDQDRSEEPAP